MHGLGEHLVQLTSRLEKLERRVDELEELAASDGENITAIYHELTAIHKRGGGGA